MSKVSQPTEETKNFFEKAYGSICDNIDRLKGKEITDDDLDQLKQQIKISMMFVAQDAQQSVYDKRAEEILEKVLPMRRAG